MLAYWLGGTRAARPEVYKSASPATHITSDDPPVCLFHGERDRLVPLALSQTFHRALRAEGIRSQFYVVPGVGHLGAFLDEEALGQAVRFLDGVLKSSTGK
jgi:dipeptidyl aminopeptidase/acylaminoacyl peptidase